MECTNCGLRYVGHRRSALAFGRNGPEETAAKVRAANQNLRYLRLEEEHRLLENGEMEARLESLLFGGPPRRQPTPPAGLRLGRVDLFNRTILGSLGKLLSVNSATCSNAGLAWFKTSRSVV